MCGLADGVLCLSAQKRTAGVTRRKERGAWQSTIAVSKLYPAARASPLLPPLTGRGKITNEFDGMTHDYTHKGGVVHTEILLPDHAPAEYADRAVLWNEVEKIEKAKNAQLAREIEISLPRELTREQSISLVRGYVERHFVAAGMCADVCHTRHRRRQPPRPYHADNAPF